MKKHYILILFPVLILLSCGQTNKLSESDRLWMPYKGNEMLVFKSNAGDIDTIFFIRKDTLWGYPDPALSTNKYEEVAIFSKHSDPYAIDGHRYLESYFLKIKKTISGKAELVIGLSAKDAKFYRLSPIKIDSLNKVKPVTLQTTYGQHDDVYEIQTDDYGKDFYNRSNFVTKLYWSKSSGLLRYDKKDGVYWVLLK